MENNFDFFETNSIKEISKKTCINEEDLKRLKNSEFKSFTKTKGLGFIKIIEREYKVDLSELREEFLKYMDINKKQDSVELFVATPKKSNAPKYIAAVILAFFSAAILYFLYMNSQKDLSFKQQNFDKNPIIKEAKKVSGISDTNKTLFESENQNDLSKTEASTKEINETVKKDDEQNSKTVTKEENVSKSDQAIQAQKPIVEKTDMKPADVNITKPILSLQKEDKAIIVPKRKIWVGEISLDNYKKRSFLRDYNITLNITSDTLITTGHGMFDIVYRGKKYSFSSKKAVKLFIRNGEVKEINRDEFLQLNRGKYW